MISIGTVRSAPKPWQEGQFDINYCSPVSPCSGSNPGSELWRQMCLTHRRDAEQSIRQCTEFGAALAVSVGTKALNKLDAMAPVSNALPKSLFVRQRSTQPQGALEIWQHSGCGDRTGRGSQWAGSFSEPLTLSFIKSSQKAVSSSSRCAIPTGTEGKTNPVQGQYQPSLLTLLSLLGSAGCGDSPAPSSSTKPRVVLQLPPSHLPLGLPTQGRSQRMKQNSSGSDLLVNTALTPPHFNTALPLLCWRFCSGGF